MTDGSEVLPEQEAYTEAIVARTPDNGIIVSNLGVSSWILSAVEDRPRNYYMKGAMGATTPLGLGLAMSRDEQVTVLDGDGSLLMSLGTLATISRQDPDNLVVIVMNNSQFATTGGQPSLADEINIASAAEDCGLFPPTSPHSIRSRMCTPTQSHTMAPPYSTATCGRPSRTNTPTLTTLIRS
ncbi:thiamine pyrophosphate-dependent enzyme [Halalkalicoccus salilacus]|uniref:thiamine pyrophosphate-dependent enzyme n=1 Tax=Halalkalicoccus sp. GCM10025704 TaxID=3252662 RepID=UPI0036237908